MRRGTSSKTSKLAELRVERGLGQRELAELSGVTLQQIQKYEYGERDMKNAALKNALALADALGVHPRDLI